MTRKRSLSFVFLIIAVMVLPSAVALGWYQMSQNPSLRPLGVTKEALSAYNGGADGLEIVAMVEWVPPRTGNYTKARLAQSLAQSFAAKGVEVRIEFREGRQATRVSYRVGKTVLGPYSTARASEGIGAAVEAYKMW